MIARIATKLRIKYIIIFMALAVVLSLSFYSCTLLAPVSKEPVVEEKEEDEVVSEEKESVVNITEDEEEKDIKVESPQPDQVISSPLIIKGEAIGTWFFEADFPVILEDGDGNIIVEHYAQALSDWMTEDFVPFEAVIEFEKPSTETGSLILEKNNPSGLPENEDSIMIPVRFE
jgi:hypothetical protein